MEAAAVDAVVDGLKKSGVDFISLMPDSDFTILQERVANEQAFYLHSGEQRGHRCRCLRRSLAQWKTARAGG